MSYELKKLTQESMEHDYSKHKINRVILEDIQNSNFEELIKLGAKALFDYVNTSYSYHSKKERIEDLVNKYPDAYELMEDILVRTIQTKGVEEFTSVVGRLAAIIPGTSDVWDSVKTAAEVLAVGAACKLYIITPAHESDTGTITLQSCISPSAEVTAEIARTKYVPPMLCKPNEVIKNSHNGYLTFEKSVILGVQNYHDGEQCLDMINMFNQTALSLDTRMIKNHMEMPNKELDTPEKKDNFIQMAVASREVYMEIIANGNEFYNTHANDTRGRVYSNGYHVHIQSTSYKKSLINLAKKELIVCE